MDPVNVQIPSSPEWQPRINPTAFTATQFLFLSLAIIACAARTYTRVYRFKRVTADDVLLILACVFFAASTGLIHYGKNLMYYTTYVNLRLVVPTVDYSQLGFKFSIIDNAVTILVWAAMFSVKLSFVLFFRQLISRVRGIKIWWWIVFVVVCCAAPVNMFMGFFICPEFDVKVIHQKCPTSSIIAKTAVYLTVSCVLDIATDLLVLSIPIALLWKVQIDLKRKLALLTVLCLSVFMIIIAVVRISLSQIQLPDGRRGPDTPWLMFWQNMEAATAIIMVSVTAFRSMLGQAKTSSKGSGGHSAGSKKWISLKSHSRSGSHPKADRIIKTTEVSHSFDDKTDWSRPSISQPVRSLSHDEQIRLAGEVPRDWSQEHLPAKVSAPLYEVRVHSTTDRKEDASSFV